MARQVLIAVKDKNGNSQTQAVSRKAFEQIYSRDPEKYKLINGDAAAREIETAPKNYGRKVKTNTGGGEPASEMQSAADIAANLGIEKKSDELESFDLDESADELNSEIENESKSKAKQSDDSKNAGAAGSSTRKARSRTRTGNKKKNS